MNANTFYVDESSDLSLFDKKGRIVVGRDGISKYFMVGTAKILKVEDIKIEFENLRKEIECSRYFQGVPSLKTTLTFFHACKDISEIRYEVFKILAKYPTHVYVAIKRKRELSIIAKNQFLANKTKINNNELYDDLVKELFTNLLHEADENVIYFANRGKSNRNKYLELAIEKAQNKYNQKYDLSIKKPTKVHSHWPWEITGLQVIDYYLWALQRLFEREEDRFYNFLSDRYKLIMDLDDKRHNEYGEIYNDNNVLNINKIKPFES